MRWFPYTDLQFAALRASQSRGRLRKSNALYPVDGVVIWGPGPTAASSVPANSSIDPRPALRAQVGLFGEGAEPVVRRKVHALSNAVRRSSRVGCVDLLCRCFARHADASL
jgi:hypothetical protein